MISKALDRAILFVEEFRKIDVELPMQTAAVFLAVAKKPGSTMTEIAAEVKIAKNSVSRNVFKLSTAFGNGVVEFREDPKDRRNKVVSLTADGERILRSLLHLTGEGT